MPLDRLVLILVCVIVAAGATVWLATFLAAIVTMPAVAALVLVPIALGVYVFWRVIQDRLNNSDDDHYDRIEK